VSGVAIHPYATALRRRARELGLVPATGVNGEPTPPKADTTSEYDACPPAPVVAPPPAVLTGTTTLGRSARGTAVHEVRRVYATLSAEYTCGNLGHKVAATKGRADEITCNRCRATVRRRLRR
jgi:hypothetical protein